MTKDESPNDERMTKAKGRMTKAGAAAYPRTASVSSFVPRPSFVIRAFVIRHSFVIRGFVIRHFALLQRGPLPSPPGALFARLNAPRAGGQNSQPIVKPRDKKFAEIRFCLGGGCGFDAPKRAHLVHLNRILRATPKRLCRSLGGVFRRPGPESGPRLRQARFDKGRPGRRTPKACLGYGGQTAKTPAFAQPGFEGGTKAENTGWEGRRPLDLCSPLLCPSLVDISCSIFDILLFFGGNCP